MRLSVFDHQGNFLRDVGGGELLEFTHTDELNGEDSVRIATTAELAQGNRLVWRDRDGRAHEHVCQDPQATRELGAPIYADEAVCSICETAYDRIDDVRPRSYSYLRALQAALAPTRWEPGTVDQAGTVSSGLTFYRTDARTAINDILACGGEMEVTYATTGGEITARRVGIRAHRGSSTGHRRFTYRKDLRSLSRTEHWGAITACYGYGKGVAVSDGDGAVSGYGRKLTFGDVNGGLDYVYDSAALKAWGRPDGRGGLAHVFGTFEDGDCEDAATLLAETKAYLDAHKVPGVTYEASVADLVAMGRDWEGVGVGDDVQIVDPGFTPTLRCEGRVTKLVTDYVAGTQEVTLGNVTETLADAWAAQQAGISSLSRRSASWDVAASARPSWLERLVSNLNERFNVMGASYQYTSFEQGTIWASVPLDEDGRPTASGGFAIQICSQGFRIASGTTADGGWNWRTFGTGEGFTADEINTGTLNANLIRAGLLQDRTGANYWNLDTGVLSMTRGTINAGMISSGTYTVRDSSGKVLLQIGGGIEGGIAIVNPSSGVLVPIRRAVFSQPTPIPSAGGATDDLSRSTCPHTGWNIAGNVEEFERYGHTLRAVTANTGSATSLMVIFSTYVSAKPIRWIVFSDVLREATSAYTKGVHITYDGKRYVSSIPYCKGQVTSNYGVTVSGGGTSRSDGRSGVNVMSVAGGPSARPHLLYTKWGNDAQTFSTYHIMAWPFPKTTTDGGTQAVYDAVGRNDFVGSQTQVLLFQNLAQYTDYTVTLSVTHSIGIDLNNYTYDNTRVSNTPISSISTVLQGGIVIPV